MTGTELVEDVLNRLLGVKVCLEEMLNVDGIEEGYREAFDKALEAAMELEDSLTAGR